VVDSVEVAQIEALIATPIISMAMRAIHQKQMPALRCVDCQL